ncbi:MAG: cytidylate kinase family protein [Erysipelotrichaceae bacterium]|nr:cytidylate kinase family protein [Erysipelotrichaceae bacterium]
MYDCIVMDSEYCSMGRWISVIAGDVLKLKLYEGRDLIALADEEWLDEAKLYDFDNSLGDMTAERLREDDEFWRIHAALSKAIKKAVALGPCIIHERAASVILRDECKMLRVHLYNTNMTNRIPRAIGDKTYDLEAKSRSEVIDFIKKEDNKRKVYRDVVEPGSWGVKESYDLCLDSDMLSREKCAEILITAYKDVEIDLDHAQEVVRDSFVWSK